MVFASAEVHRAAVASGSAVVEDATVDLHLFCVGVGHGHRAASDALSIPEDAAS